MSRPLPTVNALDLLARTISALEWERDRLRVQRDNEGANLRNIHINEMRVFQAHLTALFAAAKPCANAYAFGVPTRAEIRQMVVALANLGVSL